MSLQQQKRMGKLFARAADEHQMEQVIENLWLLQLLRFTAGGRRFRRARREARGKTNNQPPRVAEGADAAGIHTGTQLHTCNHRRLLQSYLIILLLPPPGRSLQIMSAAQEFLDLWQSNDTSPKTIAKVEAILSSTPLSGRMIHGNRNRASFGVYLSFDEWKRLSWVFGPEAIRNFIGKSPRDICLELGFGEEWLDAKLDKGIEFVLAIFPSDSANVKHATWEGVEYLLEAHYPEVWDKIHVHLPRIQEIKTTEELYDIAGYDMEAVNLVGRYDHQTGESHDDRYISLQRLMKREGTLVEVRQFLWDEIGLKKLYSGLGNTVNDDGEVGPPEYLAANKRLADINGLVTIHVVPSKEYKARWDESCNVAKGTGRLTAHS